MKGSDGPLAPGVVVVVEQLRRAVAGGIGTYARGLVHGLTALGESGRRTFPVRLHASRPPARPDPLGGLGAPVHASPVPARALQWAWAVGLAPPSGGAVVHATSLAAPPSRVPLVVTVHDLCWRRYPAAYPRRGRAWHERALRRAARRAAAFVVPSTAVAEELVGAGWGLERARVRVVEEGADHLPSPDEAGARRLLAGLGAHGPFLLAVGTLEPRKNLERLVTAYGRVRGELPEPWPLVLAGPTGWGAAMRPAPGVLLTGPLPDGVLAGLYRLARCCVYVPLAEGFGLPVVEAMRAGTPVVSSDVPSAASASLVVDPLDVDAIAAGILDAATCEATRERLVAAGTARVEGLTWEACAAAHVAVWEDVAGG